MYQLVFQPNTHSSLSVEFSGPVLAVGRREDNDVVIDDPAVSAQHARFYVEEGSLYVLDGGSRNGTWVNGRRVCREKLGPGDGISIAHRVEVLVLEESAFEGFARPDPATFKELAESVRALFLKRTP